MKGKRGKGKEGVWWELSRADPAGVPTYWFRILWARIRRRMRFLRHFQRMWPRFFHTLELRFIRVLPGERAALPGGCY